MTRLVSAEIERYAIDHTTPLPTYLADLVRETKEKRGSVGMLSGPVVGTLLQFLVCASGARRVLEIGTFTGFSAQMMAAALPDDGVLVTCDINEESAELALEYFGKSPHGHKIDLRMGPALQTLETLTGPFDLVFIDADKSGYVDYYERALELLSPRGIIVVDNVLWSGQVLNPISDTDHAIARFNRHVRDDPRVRHVLLPVRDGLMLVHRA